MPFNDRFVQGARSVGSVVWGVILSLVGFLFIGVGIFFFIKPDSIANLGGNGNDGGLILKLLFILMGLVSLAVGVFMIARVVKAIQDSKPSTKTNIDGCLVTDEDSNAHYVTDTKYFFHWGGTMNLCYYLEEWNGDLVYECRLRRYHLFGAKTYEFIDIPNESVRRFKMGKTIVAKSNEGTTSTRQFKINGAMCFDYLRQRGYELKPCYDEKALIRYELWKMEDKVMDIVPCSAKDPWDETKTNILHFGKGVYRLEIHDCNLEVAVVAGFIVSEIEAVY